MYVLLEIVYIGKFWWLISLKLNMLCPSSEILGHVIVIRLIFISSVFDFIHRDTCFQVVNMISRKFKSKINDLNESACVHYNEIKEIIWMCMYGNRNDTLAWVVNILD